MYTSHIGSCGTKSLPTGWNIKNNTRGDEKILPISRFGSCLVIFTGMRITASIFRIIFSLYVPSTYTVLIYIFVYMNIFMTYISVGVCSISKLNMILLQRFIYSLKIYSISQYRRHIMMYIPWMKINLPNSTMHNIMYSCRYLWCTLCVKHKYQLIGN